MIIKTKNKFSVVVTDKEEIRPILPLQTGILFPGTMITLQIGRKDNLRLLEDCKIGGELVTSYSPHRRDDDDSAPIHQIGVLAVIRDIKKGVGNSRMVILEGCRRVSIVEIKSKKPYIKALIDNIQPNTKVSRDLKSKVKEVIETAEEITSLDPNFTPEHLEVLKMSEDDISLLLDTTASTFSISLEAQQKILETISLSSRADALIEFLNIELNKTATVHSINVNTEKNLEEEQKRAFLRQQLHEIKKLLGEDFTEEKEAARIKKMIKEMHNLPAEVSARAMIEADRLAQLSTASAEYGVTKNYLDWILGIPWNIYKKDNYDIKEAESILSKEYYGPKNLKEQILQKISIRQHLDGYNDSPALCFVGAPGTGKAAIAKAVAKALGKDFARISVGGIGEVHEIKGMTRNFLGAMPGKIIRALKEIGSADPVMLIEDIDYFNIDNDSSVNMALLEAFDPRLNNNFIDHYVGVPFDLSKIMFICSVRAYEEIPEQFIPRMEIIELPGYIENEKITITKRYIIPSLLKKHKLTKAELKISDKILSTIINYYTQEAGLLGLSQQLEKIYRKVLLEKSTGKKKNWVITEKNIETYLGLPIFIPEKAEKSADIGIAAGLAWTGAGGDLMFIEGLKMKGDGQINSTGSLGEVMKESIQAAHSYIRSKADILGIDFNDFNDFDIHIHFPSGAIPKDGPSAGVSVCLVLASVMSERPIRNDIAMTGEVTLRGKVLPVGGIKEKVSAAYRAGIYEVAIPKENKKDIKDLPKEILRKTKIHYLEQVDELFELCLLDFKPSSFTLEKILAEEIENAKKRTKSRKTKTKAKPKTKTKAAKTTKKK